MGFLTILLISKLNMQLKILANKINTATLHPINTHLSKFFAANKCTPNYKLDENIFKMLIQRNILPIDPNKKKNPKTSYID